MASNSVISPKNLDASKITLKEPRKNAKGGTSVQIGYADQPLKLRIPKSKFPGGVFVREDDKTGKVDYKLIASLNGCDPYIQQDAGPEAGDVGKVYNFLRAMEEKIIAAAAANSVKWFGKSRTIDGIRDSFKSILSASRDKGSSEPNGKYPPSLGVKIPVYDGQVKMQVIDAKGNPVYVTPENITDVFPKRVEANLIISPSIYVVNASFGVSWRVEYAQVFPSETVSAKNLFLDEDVPEEDEAEEGAGTQLTASAFQDDPDTAPAPPAVPPPAPMAEAAVVPASRRRRAA